MSISKKRSMVERARLVVATHQSIVAEIERMEPQEAEEAGVRFLRAVHDLPANLLAGLPYDEQILNYKNHCARFSRGLVALGATIPDFIAPHAGQSSEWAASIYRERAQLLARLFDQALLESESSHAQ